MHAHFAEQISLDYTGIVYEYFPNTHRLFCTLYFKQGRLHRTDGPAVIYVGGLCNWYYDGEKLSPQELFEKLTDEEREQAIWNINEWK